MDSSFLQTFGEMIYCFFDILIFDCLKTRNHLYTVFLDSYYDIRRTKKKEKKENASPTALFDTPLPLPPAPIKKTENREYFF